MSLVKDPGSGLMLPRAFVDQKVALKQTIDEIVEKAVMANQHLSGTYYLVLHMKFDKLMSDEFHISEPVVTQKLPPFTSNQLVFWVNNRKGFFELLWMVTRGADKKLKVDFNTQGVAYLQAKGAMPK